MLVNSAMLWNPVNQLGVSGEDIEVLAKWLLLTKANSSQVDGRTIPSCLDKLNTWLEVAQVGSIVRLGLKFRECSNFDRTI